MIQEQRAAEALRKGILGLEGKYGTIARNLGQPIISHGGKWFESNNADFLNFDFCEEAEEEEMPTWDENESVGEVGWHWDGLKYGIHAEIRYLTDKKELLVTYKGFPVYMEIQGELESYNPNGEWEEKLEQVYQMARRKENKYRQETVKEQKAESRKTAMGWLEKLRERWGI